MIHVNITFTDQFQKLHIWDPQSVKVYRNMVGLIVAKKYGINFTNTKDPQQVI